MKHMKRQKVPKSWPITRKGSAYIVKANFNPTKGVPLLVFLRDMLKIAKNRKEVKKALYEKNITLNSRPAKDEKNSVLLLDKVGIVPSKKYYQLDLSNNGKFIVEEVKESESNMKISKIIDKKTLKGKKTQINLLDGRNFISDIKCNVDDSVLINLKEKKIEKCLPLKENSNVLVFAGKHTGKKGKITKLETERKIASLESNGEKINVLIKQIMITE